MLCIQLGAGASAAALYLQLAKQSTSKTGLVRLDSSSIAPSWYCGCTTPDRDWKLPSCRSAGITIVCSSPVSKEYLRGTANVLLSIRSTSRSLGLRHVHVRHRSMGMTVLGICSWAQCWDHQLLHRIGLRFGCSSRLDALQMPWLVVANAL
jgi:hypothetical protein